MRSTARDTGSPETAAGGRDQSGGVRRQARDTARSAILGAARALFAEKGFAAASVTAIAARAGFTKGLVHHYFGSKRELWREVIDEYAREGRAREEAFGEARPDLDSIVARLRGSFRFFQSNSEYLRIATWAELEADEGLPRSLEDLMHQHTDQVQRAQSSGAVRGDLDPRHVHAMTYSLMTGWFQTKRFFCPAWGRDPQAAAVDEAFLEDMLVFVRGGLEAVARRRRASPASAGGVAGDKRPTQRRRT
jgi:AcrR family transcriptional regulator